MQQVLRISASCPPLILPRPQEILPSKTPRVLSRFPCNVQRATVSCYAMLHAGKGHKFYNRSCRLDGIKAKDGQHTYSSCSAYQQLRALIVGQGGRRTRGRVFTHKKLAVVLDTTARRGAKSEPLAIFVRTPEEEILQLFLCHGFSILLLFAIIFVSYFLSKLS